MKVFAPTITEQLYTLAQQASQERNLATASLLLDENDQIVTSSASRVASDQNALSHADMIVIHDGCKLQKSVSLRGYSVISVFEPSLMALCACYWAGISKYYYYLPAAKYAKDIPWATESGALNKAEVAKSFAEPVSLVLLEDTDQQFEHLCDLYIKDVIKKP
jgi:tRNA(Arg) A34 adenosine deaminase TadA